ncbi:MAG: extracellular solute-binding protein [Anaerolineae bacterium]|nr:MAG: extracellular solute-binding protein [Anaerolineae bacterium]
MRRVGVLLLIGIVLLVGCGNKDDGTQGQSDSSRQRTPAPRATPTFTGPVSLSMWHPYQGANADALQAAAATFTDANPTLTLTLEYHPPDTLLTDYQQAVRQGGGPDILVTQPSWVGGLVENRLILPLDTALIDEIGTRTDSALFQSLDYQDQYWASPLTADLLVMYSKIADITLVPRGIDDLLVVVGENGVVFSADPINLLGLYPSGAFFDAGGRPVVDEEGLTTLGTLLQTLAVNPNVTFSDDTAAFVTGSASALIAPASLYPTLSAALGDQLRISLLPEVTAGVAWRPILDLTLLTVNVNVTDESLAAASLFMAYLISPEVQAQLAEQGDFMPLMNITSTTDSATRLYIQQMRSAQSTTLDHDFYITFLPDFANLLTQMRQPGADIPALIGTWLPESAIQ